MKHGANTKYDEYLQSDRWKELRRQALDAAENRCQLCYSPDALEVHHRTYQRLGFEKPSDLTVLCATCHCRHHRFMSATPDVADAIGEVLASLYEKQQQI